MRYTVHERAETFTRALTDLAREVEDRLDRALATARRDGRVGTLRLRVIR